MPKHPAKKKTNKNKTTSKSLPGSGMAKKAGKAIEERQRKRKEMMKRAMGK